MVSLILFVLCESFLIVVHRPPIYLLSQHLLRDGSRVAVVGIWGQRWVHTLDKLPSSHKTTEGCWQAFTLTSADKLEFPSLPRVSVFGPWECVANLCSHSETCKWYIGKALRRKSNLKPPCREVMGANYCNHWVSMHQPTSRFYYVKAAESSPF